jgi:hypothetical protein
MLWPASNIVAAFYYGGHIFEEVTHVNSLPMHLSAASLILFGLTSTDTHRKSDIPAYRLQHSGPKIAFSLKREGPYQMYIMGGDGQGQTRLIRSEFQDRFRSLPRLR